MGKQSVSDSEARLRELIREANGAAKTLSQQLRESHAEIQRDLAKTVSDAVNKGEHHIINLMSDRFNREMDALSGDLAKRLAQATIDIQAVIDATLEMFLGRSVYEMAMQVVRGKPASESSAVSMPVVRHLMDYARMTRDANNAQIREMVEQYDSLGARLRFNLTGQPLRTREGGMPGMYDIAEQSFHYRLCVAKSELPTPYVPSETRQCRSCQTDVWYDPKASPIPDGKQEYIICGGCMDSVAFSMAERNSNDNPPGN